jgi:hypothetical protein
VVLTKGDIIDLEIIFKINKRNFIDTFQIWLTNQHTFLVYSEPIFLKLKSFYQNFEYSKNIQKSVLNDKLSFDDPILVDCQVFSKNKSLKRSVVKCTNGDAILLGNNIEFKEVSREKINIINVENIKLLTTLIQKNQDQDIEVVLIFEPIFHNKYRYNIKTISELFPNTKIIDLSDFSLKDEYWADIGHLNYLGREEYSLELIRRLK